MLMAVLTVRLNARYGLAMSVFVCCLLHAMAMRAQVPLPLISPRTDTLWTRLASASGIVEYQASDLGGSVPTLVTAVTLHADAATRRQLLVCYDPLTGDSLRSIETGHRASIRDVAFAAQADLLATAEHGVINLWSWPTMHRLHTFRGSFTALPSVLLTRDGKRLFSGLDAVMYDTECGDTVWRFITILDGTKARPVMTPDDRYIVLARTQYVGARDVGVLLDAATGLPVDVFHGGSGADAIASIAVTDDARYVAISRLPRSGGHGSCVIYDRLSRDVAGVIALHGDPDTDGMRCRFAPNGGGLLLYRNVEGCQPGDYLYSNTGGNPTVVWWPFFEQRFTRDGTRQFGANGRYAWVGPFAMPVASVSTPLDSAPFSICVSGVQTLHISGLPMAEGILTVEAMTYDGKLCVSSDVDVRDGSCWVNHTADLRGPILMRVLRDQELLGMAGVLIP